MGHECGGDLLTKKGGGRQAEKGETRQTMGTVRMDRETLCF